MFFRKSWRWEEAVWERDEWGYVPRSSLGRKMKERKRVGPGYSWTGILQWSGSPWPRSRLWRESQGWALEAVKAVRAGPQCIPRGCPLCWLLTHADRNFILCILCMPDTYQCLAYGRFLISCFLHLNYMESRLLNLHSDFSEEPSKFRFAFELLRSALCFPPCPCHYPGCLHRPVSSADQWERKEVWSCGRKSSLRTRWSGLTSYWMP